jgi:hypothetical protein
LAGETTVVAKAKLTIQGEKLLERAKGTSYLDLVDPAHEADVEVIPDVPLIQTANDAIETLQLFHERVESEYQSAYRRALPWARLAGAVLGQVKELLPHGEFLPWVQAHTNVSPRQCQSYMAVARGWEDVLSSNTKLTSYLNSADKEPTIAQAAAAVVAWEKDQKGQTEKSPFAAKRKISESKLSNTIQNYLEGFTPETRQEQALVKLLQSVLTKLEQI